MCFNKVEGPKTLRRHTLVKKSITQITEDFIKKIGEIFKESEKLYETEEAYKENLELYEQLTGGLIMQNPDRAETISQNAAYLQRFVKGIGICKKDERANNGGCTEPHISHVLAARLSSRPLAWSETTLKHLAPILAAGKLTLNRKSTDNEQPVSLRKAAI